MVEVLERDARTAVAGVDRRRPGRVEYANPHLVKLLRRAPTAEAPAAADVVYRSPREADSLAAARGIATASIFGAMAWAGAAMGVWLLLRA